MGRDPFFRDEVIVDRYTVVRPFTKGLSATIEVEPGHVLDVSGRLVLTGECACGDELTYVGGNYGDLTTKEVWAQQHIPTVKNSVSLLLFPLLSSLTRPLTSTFPSVALFKASHRVVRQRHTNSFHCNYCWKWSGGGISTTVLNCLRHKLWKNHPSCVLQR